VVAPSPVRRAAKIAGLAFLLGALVATAGVPPARAAASRERAASAPTAPASIAVATPRHAAPPEPAPQRTCAGAIAALAPVRIAFVGSTRQPVEGIDVPACRAGSRWCLAHATATAPA
jgi:hypothetical protein